MFWMMDVYGNWCPKGKKIRKKIRRVKVPTSYLRVLFEGTVLCKIVG